MESDPRRVVEKGYDRIAHHYAEWIEEIHDDPRLRFLTELTDRLPSAASAVDLGCGSGKPCTAILAEHHDVLGVDVSATQLELARQNVPRARFMREDATRLRLDPGSVDAVTAFYSITHLPRDEHAALFARIARWLRPGGHFLATLGCGETDGTVDDWLGVPMFFSSFDAQRNRELLEEAGFALLIDEIVTMREPEGPVTFQWVLARAEPEHETDYHTCDSFSS
ncbi:class I SAM-dependent methyltransferase [Saccharopolyspora shandongensis]|uniref:class I SAM-dependent methyltransferase n=1 Tax=Saccharopolyspora shandongensis TaxID=418495 RepID=UPI0034106BD1